MRVKREGKGPSQGTHLVSIHHEGHAPRDRGIRTGIRESFAAPPSPRPVGRKGSRAPQVLADRADVTTRYPAVLWSATPIRAEPAFPRQREADACLAHSDLLQSAPRAAG